VACVRELASSNQLSKVFLIILSLMTKGACGNVVEALCYKPEGRGFESRYHWMFSLPNPSSRTKVLGLTLPLTEMRTMNLPGR
jgi:hypothetical protein